MDKEKCRILLKKMDQKMKEAENIKFDFMGLRQMRKLDEWAEIESKLFTECFGGE